MEDEAESFAIRARLSPTASEKQEQVLVYAQHVNRLSPDVLARLSDGIVGLELNMAPSENERSVTAGGASSGGYLGDNAAYDDDVLEIDQDDIEDDDDQEQPNEDFEAPLNDDVLFTFPKCDYYIWSC